MFAIFQILNHLLKLTYLGCQLYHKFFVTLVAGCHRVQSLLHGVNHVKQPPVRCPEVVDLVYVILTFHFSYSYSHGRRIGYVAILETLAESIITQIYRVTRR